MQKLQHISRTGILIRALDCLLSRHLLIAPIGPIYFSSTLYDSEIYGEFMFAKIIVFEYKPAMTFTPAQDHQVELSISIVHKISCIPEIQSVCSLLN